MPSYAKDSLGERMKQYEVPTTSRRAFKGQPVIVRLDGKNFHAFTKGLERPFDSMLTKLMVATTNSLVQRFGASFGYTQSDEITLGFYVPSHSKAELIFDGRLQKMESLIPATCTAIFNRDLETYLPKKAAELPVFDGRAFMVPSLLEGYNNVVWRQKDCRRNAISMAAQAHFSHKSLHGQSSKMMIDRLRKEAGVEFEEYPASFRWGTFLRRVEVLKPLDPETQAKLKSLGRPFPVEPMRRTEVQSECVWLQDLDEAASYLFQGGPIVYRADLETVDEED